MKPPPERLRPCEHSRCKRQVFGATIVRSRGTPIDLLVDAQPVTWPEGGRIKLLDSRHSAHQLADKLTAATMYRGFGTELYIEHREVCEAQQRRTKAKKADGSHA